MTRDCLLVGVSLLASLAAHARAPVLFSVQGILTDGEGMPIEDLVDVDGTTYCQARCCRLVAQ